MRFLAYEGGRGAFVRLVEGVVVVMRGGRAARLGFEDESPCWEGEVGVEADSVAAMSDGVAFLAGLQSHKLLFLIFRICENAPTEGQ